jgi:predicted transcriptional regulator of viral defense system
MTTQEQPAESTKPVLPDGAALPDGVLRARRLTELGLSRTQIKNLTDSGKLLHLGRGLYSRPDSSTTENHDLVQVAARVPHGVVCLSSALQFHQLTTQNPWRVHLMIVRGARPPQLDHPPLFLVYAAGDSFTEGIEEHEIEGVTVKVTTVAKTVADCFKYRNKIGLDVALEALRESLSERRATRAQIRAFAKICRVENVIKPYLEAMSL